MSAFSELVDGQLDPAILDQFGDEISYTPRAGDSYTLTCVLDSGEAVQTGERVYQTAWAPFSSFTGGEPARGDSVTADGVTYRVADVEREALGGRKLKLSVSNV